VRCGHCQSVFNALDSLVEELVVMPTPVDTAPANDEAPVAFEIDHEAPTIAVSPALTYEESTASTPPAQHADDQPVDEQPPEATFEAQATEAVVSAPAADMAAAPVVDIPADIPADIADDALVSTSVEAFVVESVSASTVATVATVATHNAPTPLVNSHRDAPAALLGTPAYEPDNATPEPRDTIDNSDAPGAQFAWLWAGSIVLALLVLLIQVALVNRVELATVLPAARPYLVAVCDITNCRVELPKKVELISIESSDLHPDPAYPGQPGRLSLQAQLLSRAPFAQAWPALELTLTDTNDQPVLRRVLRADEYLNSPAASRLAAGIPSQQDVTIALALDSGELTASGYRLYLFYP
jgi:hypothetical protein